MLMMRTVWFDTSGTGRLMLVLLVLLAFNAAGKWQVMLMMRTVCFDTSGTGRLNACIACAPGLSGTRDMAADAHNAKGLL